METFISAIKLSAGFGASAFLGIVIDERTNVPIGSIMAVAGTVICATWWVSSKFTSIDDHLKQLNARMDELPCGRKCKTNDD